MSWFESLIHVGLEFLRARSDLELTVILFLWCVIPLVWGLLHGGRKK